MNPFLVNLEKELQLELADILHREELLWFQRSRTKWLQDGDRNTRYYHIKATNRKKRNNICMLRGDDGQWKDDLEEIKTMVSTYFISLFKEDTDVTSHTPTKYRFPVISDEEVGHLGRSVEYNEIRQALFDMAPGKALGPDGYQAGFNQIGVLFHHPFVTM